MRRLATTAAFVPAVCLRRSAARSRCPRSRARPQVLGHQIAERDDPTIGVEVYEQERRKFDAEYEVKAFPGGHFVHRESPDAFRETAFDFVTRK